MAWRPWQAWYWKVFLLLKAVVYALAVVFVLVVMRHTPWGLRHGSILTSAFAIAATLYVVWGCWVCPWLTATQPLPTFLDEPGKLLRGLRRCVWVPAILVDLLAAAMLLELMRGEAVLGQVQLVVATTAVVLLNGWCWWWSTRIGPALQATMRRMQRCPECGYDLRGGDGAACPECGAAPYRVG